MRLVVGDPPSLSPFPATAQAHSHGRKVAAALRRCLRKEIASGRLKYALPGWEEAESRRAADTATEASWRSHATVGLATAGGGLGGDMHSSWGAGYGGDVGRVDSRQ
jgi:hypothetical protein